MQKIIKNFIFAFTLVAIFSIGAFTALAMANPEASTLAASNMTNTSMTLKGIYATYDVGIINTSFDYGSDYNTVFTGNGQNIGFASQTNASGTFQYNFTGLTAGTSYCFRAVVSQNGVSGYGDTFCQPTTTPIAPVAPQVSTLAASSVTNTSMILKGIYSTSGTGIINAWFEYGANYDLVNSGNGQTLSYAAKSSASGTFQANFTGLTAGTSYCFRAVVSQNGVSGYGDTFCQPTSTPAPTLTSISPASGTQGNAYF